MAETEKYVRILICLPTKTREHKKAASKFRKRILSKFKDGNTSSKFTPSSFSGTWYSERYKEYMETEISIIFVDIIITKDNSLTDAIIFFKEVAYIEYDRQKCPQQLIWVTASQIDTIDERKFYIRKTKNN